ncbi:MAG: DUF5693 family protein, partial [Endomicrobiales bacterium]
QVSIINTFLHAHTPVLLSLIRAVYGVVIGGFLGMVLACIVRVTKKMWLHDTGDSPLLSSSLQKDENARGGVELL